MGPSHSLQETAEEEIVIDQDITAIVLLSTGRKGKCTFDIVLHAEYVFTASGTLPCFFYYMTYVC